VIHGACSSRLCELEGSTVHTAMHRRAAAAAATAVVLELVPTAVTGCGGHKVSTCAHTCSVSAAMSQENTLA
jgi:hypothetical protein